jgi:hypothetical protein
MEGSLTHNTLLDPVVDSECEDTDLEDEDEDAGELNRRFVIKLGIVPPRPSRSSGCPVYTAGCVWSEGDWSCAYDAVFMAFWSMYEQSSQVWRTDWIHLAPEWNVPLGNNFDHLVILTNTPVDAQDHTKWFSRYRDRFRDQLSNRDPRSFPRRGPLPASVSRILEIMFGRTTGPYLIQHLVCGSCQVPSQTELEVCFLPMGHGQKQTPIWLDAIWMEFVHRFKTNVARSGATCPRCQGPNKVKALKMPDVPWIWFERSEYTPVWPSLALSFDSPPQRLNYSLRAILYAGGNHFTVRFRERSGRWWRHDGQVASGVPQLDNIHSEARLLMNGTHFACILIYCRDDD